MMETYIVVNTMDTNLNQNPRFAIPVPPFLNPKTCGSASASAVHTRAVVGTENKNNKRMVRQAWRSVYSRSVLSTTTSTNGDNCSNVNHSYTVSSLNKNSASTTSSSFSSLTSSGSNEDENKNSREAANKPKAALSYFGFTRRQWLILFNFALSNFFSSIVISLQGPFYPKEAEEKGATATEYGFVFGIFEFTMFIMCPICGALIGKITPRFMFIVGIFATGSCVILFGLLDYVDDRVTFIAMSFVIRIAQACGDSAFVTASFTIIALEFPDSVATTFSWLETCFGLGLIVGPTLGGVLYEISGFFVTFLVVGCCLILLGVMTHFVLPKTDADENDSISDCSHEMLISNNIQLNQEKCAEDNTADHRMQNKRGLLSLIRIPSVALASFSVVISCSSLGFLSATLEPHLRQSFGLTPIYTGLIFIIDGGMYAISAPIWGKLCDKTKNLKVFTLIGAILTFSGFLFVGPAPFIPVPTTLWVTCLGLVLHGIGFGATLVSAFILAMRDAVAKGFGDNVNTYGLCSGLWTSCFSLGCFIGPSVGGVLLDSYGFQNGSLFVLSTQVVIVLTTLIYMFVSKSKPESESHDVTGKSTDLCNNNEAAPLLFNDKDKLISPSKQQEHLPSNQGQNYQSNLNQNSILSSLNSKELPYKQCYGSL